MSLAPTPKEIRDAEIEYHIRDAVNKLHLVVKLITDRETAGNFNAQATAPLMDLRRRFDMASGKVVKVRRLAPSR